MNFLNIITSLGFVITTLIGYWIVLSELQKALPKTDWTSERQKKVLRRTVMVIIGWTIFISILSLSGFIQNFSTFPPRFMFVLIIPLMSILWITFSKALKEILVHIPPQNIIRLQTFRVFVEILLWMLFIQNTAPIQMTFEGRNFDILAGLSAPIVAYFFSGNLVLVKIWNIVGLGLLLNIVLVAVLSLPTPLRIFPDEPSGSIVTTFPVVLLPGLLVPLAYGLHFFSLRKSVIGNP